MRKRRENEGKEKKRRKRKRKEGKELEKAREGAQERKGNGKAEIRPASVQEYVSPFVFHIRSKKTTAK